MKPSQLSMLQDLSKCYMKPRDERLMRGEIRAAVEWGHTNGKLTPWFEKDLRRLTHQYRNQIAAIRKNQKRVSER